MTAPGRRWRKRLLWSLALLLAADQAVQYGLLRDGELAGHRVAPFDPPLFHGRQRQRLAALRDGTSIRTSLFDRELGWAPRPGEHGRNVYDEFGARSYERETSSEQEAHRLALVGCSFTHGDEVAADECWAARLDALRGDVEVWNHGVGGYGLDQALLRLRRDVLPRGPDEVWLGWAPFTTLRATTHFPPLQNHWTDLLLFKPRFVLEGDDVLRLAPNPAREAADAVRLLDDQQALVAAIGATDLWMRRAPRAYAPRGSSWTHWFATTRLATTYLERRGRGVAAWLEDPGSEPARLVVALVRAAAADCSGAGIRFRLLVLPSQADLAAGSYWRGCVRRLEAAGVEVLDLSQALRGGEDAPRAAWWMPGGHYGPAASAAVAEALEAAL